MDNKKEELYSELNVTIEAGFGTIEIYKTSIGSFNVTRKDLLNYYGNPVYIIAPIGYINELPALQGFRRNNDKQWYTTVSYNIDETMIEFLDKLNEQIKKGNKLYHNF